MSAKVVLALRPAGKYERACCCKKCANGGCDLRGMKCLVVCNHFEDKGQRTKDGGGERK